MAQKFSRLKSPNQIYQHRETNLSVGCVRISERVKENSVKLYPNSSDRNCAMRNISTNLGKKINPSLRPNGSHEFAADSAMTKDAELMPAKFET